MGRILKCWNIGLIVLYQNFIQDMFSNDVIFFFFTVLLFCKKGQNSAAKGNNKIMLCPDFDACDSELVNVAL